MPAGRQLSAILLRLIFFIFLFYPTAIGIGPNVDPVLSYALFYFKECEADWKQGRHRQECPIIARLHIWNRTDWG